MGDKSEGQSFLSKSVWLVAIGLVTALILSVSSFAWFAPRVYAQSGMTAPSTGRSAVSCGYLSNLYLSSTSVAPGDTVLASGSCFDPNQTVTFSWDTAGGTPLATATTDSSGSFSNVSVPIPSNATAGTHTIFAVDQSGDNASAQITVSGTPATATPTNTATPTPSPTDTVTQTPRPTDTASVTWTSTATWTPTSSATLSPTATTTSSTAPTLSATPSPSVTPSLTKTLSATPSATVTTTLPASATPTTTTTSTGGSVTCTGFESYLYLSPTTVAPGGTVLASGDCFDANQTVTFTWETIGGTTLATSTTDFSGSFANVSVPIPASVSAGTYSIFAADQLGDNASAQITVSGTPAAATSTPTITPTTSAGGVPVSTATWTSLTTGLPSSASLHAIAFNGSGTVLAVGDGGVIVRSTNDGATWQTVVPYNASSLSLYSVTFASPTLAWAGGDAGTLYESTDGGVTWTPVVVTTSPGNPNGTQSVIIRGIAFTSPSVGYLVGGDATVYSGEEMGEIFQTTDGGQIWTLLSNVPSAEQWNAVTFNSAGVGLAVATNGTIARTTDGVDWTTAFFQSYPMVQFNDVAFTADGSTAVAVGDNVDIFRSTDAGQTWSQITPPANVSDLINLKGVGFATSGDGAVVGGTACTGCPGQTALTTVDGGATWSMTYQVTNPPPYYWKKVRCDTWVCIAVGDGGTAIGWTVSAGGPISSTPQPITTEVVGPVTLGYYPGPYQPTVIVPASPPAIVLSRQVVYAIVVTESSASGQPVTSLTEPITISIDYSGLNLSQVNPNLLQIFTSEDGVTWVPCVTTIDTVHNLVITQVNHLSQFALAAPSPNQQVPVAFIPVVLKNVSNGW